MSNLNLCTKEKLLIVEDDMAIRESLQDILEMKGYDVITAVNGKEGLMAVLQNNPTMVICDVNMPYMSGFELLESLNDCMDKELVPPFLFLTARVTNEDIRKGMSLGADDYMTKPFDIQALTETIKAKIEKRKKIMSHAVVEEQGRISSELHDNIQQLLVAAQMGFKSLKNELGVLDKDVQSTFERSLGFLIEATAEVRNVSHQIANTHEIDLKLKIENIFKQLNDTGIIKTHLSYQVEQDFKTAQKSELFRIVQETISNVLKYANAKNLFVTIESTNQSFKIQIKDDGVGFNPEKIALHGNGLNNMRKRAEKMGWRFNINSKLNKGTIILISSLT